MTVGLLLDTNYFLHFESFDEVNWNDLDIASDVELIICAVVVRELDQKKHDHRPKIQKRAKKAIKALLAGSDNRTQAGVPVELVGHEPLEALKNQALDHDLPDDVIIANALDLIERGNYSRIIIISDDAGMLLKCRTFAVESWRPPETLRLPELADSSAKKIRELEEENQRLRYAQPQLVVRLRGGDNSAPLGINPADEINQAPSSVELVQEQYPLLKPDSYLASGVTEEDRTAYNRQLRTYYEEYRNFIRLHEEYVDLCRRTFELELKVANEGRAPAEDIDIYVTLEGNFKALEPTDYPSKPNAPAIPKRPANTFDKAMVSSKSLVTLSPESWNDPFRDPTHLATLNRVDITLPNVGGPRISTGTGTRIEWHVQRLKHGDAVVLPAVFIIVPSPVPDGCRVRYYLHAGNLPDPVEDYLGFSLRATTDKLQQEV